MTAAGSGPVIVTGRLVVRRFTPSDGPDLHAYLSDPAIYAVEPGEPIDAEAATRVARERAEGADFWSLASRASGRMVGHLYFAQAEPTSWRVLERLGLRREGLLRRNACFRRGPDGSEPWTDTLVYAMLEEEVVARLARGLRDGAP